MVERLILLLFLTAYKFVTCVKILISGMFIVFSEIFIDGIGAKF